MHEKFRYKNFSEARKGFPTKFFATETKNFRWKIAILPSFLSINFFATGNVLKHSTEGFLYEMFRYCGTKKIWRKIVILPPSSSPLIHKIFRFQKFSETQKGSPTKFFGTVRRQILDGKSWYSPPPPPPPSYP